MLASDRFHPHLRSYWSCYRPPARHCRRRQADSAAGAGVRERVLGLVLGLVLELEQVLELRR
ncbi:hypothetical protein [Cyanobium sp. WAJ14-Wanaka]|uniref:hypothetical protein n=1 Tax=Cyanobium sp. WAJ14-Wanaka TaxID=2823725 RepID=UPI0020CD30ED|nr:hypothetical protein [Cyanobium sp. WAJ14-Wanaka]